MKQLFKSCGVIKSVYFASVDSPTVVQEKPKSSFQKVEEIEVGFSSNIAAFTLMCIRRYWLLVVEIYWILIRLLVWHKANRKVTKDWGYY